MCGITCLEVAENLSLDNNTMHHPWNGTKHSSMAFKPQKSKSSTNVYFFQPEILIELPSPEGSNDA